MSYILDALRKSEQERTRGAVERLQTAAANGYRERRRVLGLVAVLTVILVAVAVALVWFVRGRFTTEPEVGAVVPSAEEMVPGSPAASTAQSPLFDSTRIVDPVAQTPGEGAMDGGETAVVESGSAAAGSAPAAGNAEPVPIETLDAAARGTLPALTISVLSYSSAPQRRFVMIDGRIVREGEAITGNLTLTRIDKDRVVLERDGERFFLTP